MSPEPAEVCEVTLGHAASTKLANKEVCYMALCKQVPPKYHDYLDVFDANLAVSACPPNQPDNNFEINLQENAKLLPPH